MKNRRAVAILAALVLVINSMSFLPVNADSMGKEASACKELSILIGADASGVTPEYLAQTPTRIQAFIIFLRLKGLDTEASSYQSSNNFPDSNAANLVWAKSYMAYAKDKPELGWIGMPDGTFAPSKPIDGKAFYKVMLETLGYKQGLDFEYNDTLTFAQSKGLLNSASAIAAKKSFTVNDVAVGIYGALSTKPKNMDKKLITVMVEQNLITADKAVNAGFTLDIKPVNVTSFKSVSNNKLELEFDKEITLQKADIEISQLGGGSRLSVLSVNSSKNTAVVNTTDAVPFTAYEIKINTISPVNGLVIKDYSNKYVGVPKDTAKPTVTFEQTGSNEVALYFSEEVDRASAESLNSYSIEHDVSVFGAHLSEDGKTVTLSTSEMFVNDFYRITVQNVKDTSGNVMNRYQAHFDGMAKDNQVPSIAKVESVSNSEVLVTFSERLDAVSAQKAENYSLDNNVSISSARLDSSGKAVWLSTSLQSTGTVYKLVVQNVADVSGNYLLRKEFKFTGDAKKPSAAVMAVSDNTVLVTFTEQVNKTDAEDISNYSVNKGLSITKATLDSSGKIVTLITGEQTAHELYSLTISGVADKWGNMVDISTAKFAGMPKDTRELSYTVAGKPDGIVITFNKRVDEASAENVFNYVLDTDLGYAATATLDTTATGKVVTLLTAGQTAGRLYTIKIENVADASGNRISTDDKICSKNFIGVGGGSSSGSTDVLTLESIINIDVNTIDMIFDNELSEDELDDLKVEIDSDDTKLPSGLSYYKFFLENKNIVRVQYKTSTTNNPKIFESGAIYEAKVTGPDRLDTDNEDNIKDFAGVGNLNEAPAIVKVSPLNNTAVEIEFSEPVKGLTAGQFKINNSIEVTGVSVEDNDDIANSVILFLKSTTTLTSSKTYKLTVGSGVKDAAGLNSISTSGNYAVFDGTSDKNEAPSVDSDVELIDSYTLQLKFSEPMKNLGPGSFSVKRTSGSGSSQYVLNKAVLSESRTVATLYYKANYSPFDPDYDYELTLSSSVMDLQGTAVATDERKVEFSGTDNEPDELEVVTTSIDEDNREITIFFNKDIEAENLVMSDLELSGAGYNSSTSDRVEVGDKTVTIVLRNELDSGEKLTIKLKDSGRSHIRDYNYQTPETDELEVNTK